MADEINVEKLKNDAFDAIDALFIEEDENTSFIEKQASEQLQQPMGDAFSMLKEYSLALDWEYSDKELNRLAIHLDKIARENPDPHNQTLVKLVKAIIKYLQKAREKSFPQTLNVMTSVIDTIRDINTKNFNDDKIKSAVTLARKNVLTLKKDISKYNKKFGYSSTDEQDINVLTRLDALEEKIFNLEKQNSALKKAMIDQHQDSAIIETPDLNSTIESNTDNQLDDHDFKNENELFLDIEEPITVNVDEISLDLAAMPATNEKLFEQSNENNEDFALQNNDMHKVEQETKQNYSEYVRLFTIGKQILAVPENIINNTYRLPSKIKNDIYSMESIPLKNLSSIFQKLSKNMKGTLLGIPDIDLKKIDATIKIIDSSITKYQYAVLCSVDDRHMIVPVTAKHKNKSMLATSMYKTNSKISEYSVEINEMGAIPLVSPVKGEKI